MRDQYEEEVALAEMFIQQGINNKKPVPPKTGYCLNCDEPTDGAFCCKECREDHEKREHIKNVRGY